MSNEGLKLTKNIEEYKNATNSLISFLSEHAKTIMNTMYDLNIRTLEIDKNNSLTAKTWNHEYGSDRELFWNYDEDKRNGDLTINCNSDELGRHAYLGNNFNCGYYYPSESEFLGFAKCLKAAYAALDAKIEEKTAQAKSMIESLPA